MSKAGETRIIYDGRNPKRFHIVVFDLETSGLNPFKHEIIEIGAFKLDEATLEVIDKFECKALMRRPEDADEEALSVNGYDPEVWEREAVSQNVAARDFATWLAHGTRGRSPVDPELLVSSHYYTHSDQFQFAGHNIIGFDWPFLCNLYAREEVELLRMSRPWKDEDSDGEDDRGTYVLKSTLPAELRKSIDVMSLGTALQLAIGQAKIRSVSLRSLSRFCGFEHDKDRAHGAIYDCEMTVRVLRWFKAVMVAGNFMADQRLVKRAWETLDRNQTFLGFK